LITGSDETFRESEFYVMNEPHSPLSLRRVLIVVVPVAILGLAAYLWSSTLEPAARHELSENVFARILSANVATAATTMRFSDKDNDLVADPPDDPQKAIAPDVLVFSYVAAETESVPEGAWKPLLDALAEKSGRKVEYVHFTTVQEQLDALQKGELHIAGLNTGAVPAAVQRDGFVPLCTFGRDDGSYGYTMQVIVPADSPIKQLRDLRGHKVTFTRPDSNSGCKALLMQLRDQEDMRPDRDYTWGFSLDHEASILGVAAKKYEAAPVASDLLERMVENGDVDPAAIRTIYESERFPPATIGYVYNLAPELQASIREALPGFSLAGTELEGQFGADATKLVPVDYKNDWANARRIDQLAMRARGDQ
jgi:phosphonate transport system substrate-binding protein